MGERRCPLQNQEIKERISKENIGMKLNQVDGRSQNDVRG